MAKTYEGGTQVKSGYYVNARSFAFANIEKDGGTLPGGSEKAYLRVPVLAVMLAAPALGGLFVVALPFIGFGVAAHALVRAIAGGAKEVAATVASPAMPAGSTALTGRPVEKAATGEPARDVKAEELATEIEAKRNAKE
jgi:hypothetical protein